MKLFNPWTVFRVWCHLAPLVTAAKIPDLSPVPDPTAAPEPVPETDLVTSQAIPPVPLLLAWIGSIGGLLGTISFTETYITRLVKLIMKKTEPKKFDGEKYEIWWSSDKKALNGIKKKGDAPYGVAIQVGVDGHGLKGAGGNFPQICLWNIHGQLIGYNDQHIRIASKKYPGHQEYNEKGGHEDMPTIPDGGLTGVGIWPAPGREDLGSQQAAYVTMIKRHFDAICIAAVVIKWPDGFEWVFDGSWGRASNMSWYYSHVFDSGSNLRECFWLDHRGDLTHKKDLEEEYIADPVGSLGRTPRKDYPDYLWAANVVPEEGIPEGDDLNEGMRKNRVHEKRVPLGVKWHAPAFKAQYYNDTFNGLAVDDFVTNPAKLNWIMDPIHRSVRGGSPVLPILHPRANFSTKNPELLWEDEVKQDIPVDCLTDWYYDEKETLIEPGAGRRCRMFHDWEGNRIKGCRDNWKPKNTPRDTGEPDDEPPTLPLQERHARTLVNDKNKRGGSGTAELCRDPHSVGPNYANHDERVFCRMTDRTLWPFCDSAAGITRECFDPEAEVLVEKSGPVAKRSHYWDAIEDWHSESRFKRAA